MQPVPQKPKKYRFVHADGSVDVVTDMTTEEPKRKKDDKSSRLGRKQLSDSEYYLTPSETEPDDFEMMSQYPVFMKQVRGLRENEKSRQRQFGVDVNADLPVYYSTNRKPKSSGMDKQHGKLDGRSDMEEHYRVDLRCRRRKSNESLRELAQDVRRLMLLSYPGDQSPISENLTKEHFIVALEDPVLELKIREREPRTLDSALRVAQRFEVFRNTVKQHKQRMSRQVKEDSWIDSSSATRSDVQQCKQHELEKYGRGTSTKAKKERKNMM